MSHPFSQISRLLVIIVLCTVDAWAQSGLSRLGEFKVNTSTTGSQRNASVASTPDGRFVVAWNDDSKPGIFFQRYNAAGSPVGAETKANTNPARFPDAPSVAMDTNGNFIVTWVRENDGNGPGIAAQRFNSAGNPIGTGGVAGFAEIHVSADNFNFFDEAQDVAMAPDGRFAIVWTGNDTPTPTFFRSYIKFYNASGSVVAGPTVLGGEFDVEPVIASRPTGGYGVAWRQSPSSGDPNIVMKYFSATGVADSGVLPVDTDAARRSVAPSLAFASDGTSVVAWTELNALDGSGTSVWARRINQAGTLLSSQPFRINTATGGDQSAVCVLFDSPSTFVAGYRSVGFDTSGDTFAASRFQFGNGSAIGDEFGINTFPTGSQAPAESEHTIAADLAGNLVFVWTSSGQDGDSNGIYAEKFYQPDQGPSLSEFRINTTTFGTQETSAIAMNSTGEFVVAWRSNPQDGSGVGVYAQRYSALGVRVGPEFRVNTTTAGNQQNPTVGLDDMGRFVIVWIDEAKDGDSFGIYGKLFAADGTMLREEFRINSFTTSAQLFPRVAMNRSTGAFVVVWSSFTQDGSGYGVYGQRFNASGDPVDTEFRVNTITLNNQHFPNVATNATGAFVVVWQTQNQDAPGFGIYAQRYASNGAKTGSEIPVNTVSAPEQEYPGVAMDDAGNFVVVWESPGQDTAGEGIFARRYNSNGVPISAQSVDGTVGTGEFRVNTTFINDQLVPQIAMTPAGEFIIAWESFGADGSDFGIFAQRYSQNGLRTGTELAINQTKAGAQRLHQGAAMDSNGNYGITWASTGQDGSGAGVYATKAFVVVPDASRMAVRPISASGGTLRVVFSNVPPGGTARWRLAGAVDWRITDLGGLEPGDYLVEFEPVGGVAPDARVVTVAGAQLNIVNVAYPPTSSTTAPVSGNVSVAIKPDAVGGNTTAQFRGQWRPVGTTTWLNTGDTATGLTVGAALIEFKDLPSTLNYDFVAPPPFAVNVVASETTRLAATYTRRTRVTGAQLPTLRTLAEVTGQGTASNGPWQFAGQLQSDSGTGSGVAIDTRVVLTAAHVLYDDAALSFVTGVRWLHQRVRDQFEPAAQFPRGFYLASGYADGRRDELTRSNNPVQPGEETPASQERDYATVFFAAECARGGSSGYLRVDGAQDVLGTAGQKTIIGYPTEAATGTATISTADFGKLFSTPATDLVFTKPYVGSNAGTRVYQTTLIAGVGGMSGGPVCVQFFDGRFYPAGIYVGGTNAAFVRGIDAAVVDLIGRAVESAQGEDNNVSGGVILVANDLARSGFSVGSLQVFIETPAGTPSNVTGQTKWRLRGRSEVRAGGFTLSGLVARKEPYIIEFLPATGLETPPPREVLINGNSPRIITATYTEIKKPVFAFSGLPPAGVDLPYAFAIAVSGKPTEVTVTGLEGSGLTVTQDAKTKTFILSGAALASARGERNITFIAKNAGGESRAVFPFSIVDSVVVDFSIFNDSLGGVTITPPVYIEPAVAGSPVTERRSVLARGSGVFPLQLHVVPGERYTLRATANKGSVFTGWSGLSGETSSNLNLTIATAGDLVATFAPNPFAGLAGSYGGLLRQTSFSAETSGFILMTVSKAGAYSGKITLGGVRSSVKGRLNGSGESTALISRGKDKGAITFSPRVGLNESGEAALSGTLNATENPGDANPDRFALDALRQSYSADLPAPMEGKWTMVLPSDPDNEQTSTVFPKGHGYGVFSVAENGGVRGALVLGDGTRVSVGSYVDGQRRWRFYAAPYKLAGAGAFIGELTFEQNNSEAATGTFDWQRPGPPPPKVGIFQNGFTAKTSAVASQWTPPLRGTAALAISGWDLVLGEGVLSTAIDAKVSLDTANRFTVSPTEAETLKLTVSTGLLTGKFKPDATSKAVSFSGVMLEGESAAKGLFSLPDRTGPVTLDPP